MEKEIVYTDKYALILSDEEIKQGDYRVNIQRNTVHFVDEEPSYFNQRNDVFKKVIAHLPLSDAPILEGLPLLEKLPQVMEKKQAEITEKIFNYDNPNAKFGIEPNEVLNLNNMEKKQTAVEWYIEECRNLEYEYDTLGIGILKYIERKKEIETQAKQMEKEQHEETWAAAWNESAKSGDFDDYYNKTYGGTK